MYKKEVKIMTDRFIGLFSLVTLSFLLILSQAGCYKKPDQTISYHIYGLSYGHSYYRQDKVLLGGQSSREVPFEWIFWVIRDNGRIILVDTGFDDSKMAKKWRFESYIKPLKRLGQLGISPSDISDVILTHGHWDHIGDLSPYKNANIWIQEKEYQRARSSVNQDKPNAKGMRYKDVKLLTEAEDQGRLRLVNGQDEPIAGITMTLDGSHTVGHQYVTVQTLYGSVIIAGDANYLYENNLGDIPIGTAYSHKACLAVISKLQKEAASPLLILPGHDPMVMELFPEVSEGIVHVTSGIEIEKLSRKAEKLLGVKLKD